MAFERGSSGSGEDMMTFEEYGAWVMAQEVVEGAGPDFDTRDREGHEEERDEAEAGIELGAWE